MNEMRKKKKQRLKENKKEREAQKSEGVSNI